MNETLLPEQQTMYSVKEEGLTEKMTKILRALQEGINHEFPKALIISKGEKAEIRRAALAYLGIDSSSNRASLPISLIKLAARFELPIPKLKSNYDEQLSLSEKWALWLYCSIKLIDLHQEKANFGKSLCEAEYSQIRLLRLLNSRGHTFAKEMIFAAHHLRSKGQCLDLKQIGYFLFPSGTKADDARLNLAKDFFSNIDTK